MSNLAYETLGRVTWAVGKRKARSYFVAKKPSRAKRAVLVLGLVVVGVVVAGAALERASAP
jgi:hypothetical protein